MLKSDEIAGFDRIVIADEYRVDILQNVIFNNCDGQIHFYNRGETIIEDYFEREKIKTFGNLKNIITSYFSNKDTYDYLAKLLNYDYCLLLNGKSYNESNKDEIDEE